MKAALSSLSLSPPAFLSRAPSRMQLRKGIRVGVCRHGFYVNYVMLM